MLNHKQLHLLRKNGSNEPNTNKMICFSCTWSWYKHGVAHFIATLNPRWNFAPTSQSATSLNAINWAPISKLLTSPSGKTVFSFCQEVYRTIFAGRTDVREIMLLSRFKRKTGEEKLQRRTIPKARYFALSNKSAT